MKIAIVKPKNNEEELILMAENLGFKEILLLYEKEAAKYQNKSKSSIKIITGFLIKNVSEINKATKNNDLIFAPAQRSFFENKKIKYLINAEAMQEKDSVHQRRAGLDDVMCKLAKQNHQVVVFNTKYNIYCRQEVLGRMMQNARLCRKYKLKTLVATFASTPLEMRAPKDLDGFARLIRLR